MTVSCSDPSFYNFFFLDISFHSTLQQLVVMNGGEMYDPDIHGLDSLDGQSCSAGDKNSTGTGVSASTPSSSSAASPFSSSPPGFIEDPEEFLYYKSAIGYYCEYLWTVCVQQDRMPLILSNLRLVRDNIEFQTSV